MICLTCWCILHRVGVLLGFQWHAVSKVGAIWTRTEGTCRGLAQHKERTTGQSKSLHVFQPLLHRPLCFGRCPQHAEHFVVRCQQSDRQRMHRLIFYVSGVSYLTFYACEVPLSNTVLCRKWFLILIHSQGSCLYRLGTIRAAVQSGWINIQGHHPHIQDAGQR